MTKTYDVYFDDDCRCNNKGGGGTYDYCMDYIRSNNGTNGSDFGDYKGGTVSIRCNETEETEYYEVVR